MLLKFQRSDLVTAKSSGKQLGLDGKTVKASNGANLGFEAKLWAAADKLRNNMDAAEYKHVVLGLIFLKYISDSFQEVYEELKLTRKTTRPRRHRRIQSQKHVLGTARRPLELPAKKRQTTHYRQNRGRRHVRHRTRQRLAKRRFAKKLCSRKP